MGLSLKPFETLSALTNKLRYKNSLNCMATWEFLAIGKTGLIFFYDEDDVDEFANPVSTMYLIKKNIKEIVNIQGFTCVSY